MGAGIAAVAIGARYGAAAGLASSGGTGRGLAADSIIARRRRGPHLGTNFRYLGRGSLIAWVLISYPLIGRVRLNGIRRSARSLRAGRPGHRHFSLRRVHHGDRRGRAHGGNRWHRLALALDDGRRWFGQGLRR